MSETPGHYWYRTRLDYDRGMDGVERALASRPGESDFVALTGDILRRKGETRAAVERYERAVELAPRDASAHDIVCETWLLLRVYERARPACERARELQPDLFHANSMLAQIEIGEAGDTAAARRWLTEEVDAGPR